MELGLIAHRPIGEYIPTWNALKITLLEAGEEESEGGDPHQDIFEYTAHDDIPLPAEDLDDLKSDANFQGFEEFEPLPPVETKAVNFPEPPLGFKKWQAFWLIPLTAGILITIVSGLLLYAGTQAEWNGFWMFCIWLPLLFGVTVLLLGAMSRTARWLHVRVNTGQDEWPRRVAISFPLPLRTSAWVMRIFGHYIPGLDDIPVHEAIQALQESLTPDEPLYIQVDDSGGEKVEVYIG